MKHLLFILITCTLLSSCSNLDLNPLSEGSSENWYSTKEELDMSVAYLYHIDFWPSDLSLGNVSNTYLWTDYFTDDWTARATLSDVTAGTINSQTTVVGTMWTYRCIAAANRMLQSMDRAASSVSQDKLKIYEAQARFARAGQYARKIFLYGDVPYYTGVLSIEEALTLSRTDKSIILQAIYDDYNFAAEYLPLSYNNNEFKYPTKGAALGMKARIALQMGDWATARDAAKACMDLGIYQLYPDFYTLFLNSNKNSIETVFGTPRSIELGTPLPPYRMMEPMLRLVGGVNNGGPSWDLFCAFLCDDGLPIDESPRFNPQEPFKNRDPRCTKTIVEFGTKWLGFQYQPHPDSLQVLNYNTGKMQANKDSRAVDQYCSYNGLVRKKHIDDSWIGLRADPDNVILRYADVLLMYAEAKIELNEIDQSVLDVMNKVRARAYKVDYTQTSLYPAISTTDQTKLRQILRIERRMEFAFEGLRYFDLIRWRLAEKALTKPIYGMLEVAELREKVVKPGLWFFPSTPPIDEDGIADFSEMYNAGLIQKLAERKFDKNRQYLWPIPANEIIINKNLKQNPGY
ncbi:RagB/SusD family nutrient uptake outer membrane protein [Parabacteroides sp. Marseille-P3160]|uniref:RagB/SusD family nutrient uptake outer membrane protein n=1 Tax=Parabacteroides sp. Marseille-P3160 TaxID=1917887 RepID=UPI0009BBB2AC|nr:RagB/SusD family nutrient uptake outer membrane protein [Parabacteroides sp. Marseille-P3160]